MSINCLCLYCKNYIECSGDHYDIREERDELKEIADKLLTIVLLNGYRNQIPTTLDINTIDDFHKKTDKWRKTIRGDEYEKN